MVSQLRPFEGDRPRPAHLRKSGPGLTKAAHCTAGKEPSRVALPTITSKAFSGGAAPPPQ